MAHPSDSRVQRDLEPLLIRAAARVAAAPLRPQSIRLTPTCAIEVDGVNRTRRVLCEAYARAAALKAGQKRKLANDVLKLILAERALGGASWTKLIAVFEGAAASYLRGRSWIAKVVEVFDITVVVVALEARHRALLAEARQAQARGIASRAERHAKLAT